MVAQNFTDAKLLNPLDENYEKKLSTHLVPRYVMNVSSCTVTINPDLRPETLMFLTKNKAQVIRQVVLKPGEVAHLKNYFIVPTAHNKKTAWLAEILFESEIEKAKADYAAGKFKHLANR